jgi:hypothetical protein
VNLFQPDRGRAGAALALAALLALAGPPARGQSLGFPGPYGSAYGPTGTYNYFGGVGPYGWGAYGYGVTGFGVGPSTPSMTVANQADVRLAQQMMQSERYDIRSAQAMQASAALNRFRQQASASVSRIRRAPAGPGMPKFDVAGTAETDPASAPDPAALGQQVERLIDPAGQLLWPVPLDDLATPRMLAERRTHERNVADVYQSWVADGRAPVSAVVRARLSLKSFAQDILDSLDNRGDGPRYEKLTDRFRDLDSALQSMATTPPPA